MFWNLLQAQAPLRTAAVPLLAASAHLSARDACFYFGGVRVLEYPALVGELNEIGQRGALAGEFT